MSRPSGWMLLVFGLAAILLGGAAVNWLFLRGRPQDNEPPPVALIADLPGHRAPILCCAFSPDSATLATAHCLWQSSDPHAIDLEALPDG